MRGSANREDSANAVTVDWVGDVMAEDFTVNLRFGFTGFTVIKLAGVDGTE